MERIQRLYFSEEKVDKFLVEKVKFSNWKIILHRDKMEFLTYLQQKHTTNIYFQNITMAAGPPEDRSAPTLEQIIENGFSGCGGCCFQLNYFLHLILVALKFHSIAIAGTFIGGVRNCHLMTIVRLENDEEYLLDVACANPLDAPIPIHHLPHQRSITDGSGIFYEYRTIEATNESNDDDHGRFQVGGSLFRGEYQNELKETLRFSFSKTPRSLDHFDDAMVAIFTHSTSLFLRQPFLFRYLRHEYSEPENTAEWILVYGLHVLICGKEKRQVTSYKDYASLKEIIWKYFPDFDKGQMNAAMKVFESTTKLEAEPQY